MAKREVKPMASITIRVPFELKERFVEECELRESTMTKLLIEIIENFLKEEQ